jgi:hypothetical protein
MRLDQVEGAEHGSIVVPPGAQQIEGRQSMGVDHDSLAVNEPGLHRQLGGGIDDLRKAIV